jgi:hypothetical protein
MLRFACVGVGVAMFFMFLTYALVNGRLMIRACAGK